MISDRTVDELRSYAGDHPVISLYVGMRPGEVRGLGTRIKDLLDPLREQASEWPRAEAMALRDAIDDLAQNAEGLVGRSGGGVAVFRSAPAGLNESVTLPSRVRDRAIIDRTPYLRPLDTIAEYYRPYCAVVIGRRDASIFRFRMGELEAWEVLRDESVRKSNFGGFGGYEEQRVRAHAEELATRHYRTVAERIRTLKAENGFDLLLIGGPQPHIEGLRDQLAPDVLASIAGTFTVDPNTMTPAIVRDACAEVAGAYEVEREAADVADLFEAHASGQPASIGLPRTLDAVNQRAVQTLLVQAQATIPGARCLACGWLDQITGVCPACGEAMARVPDLLDAMSDAVRNSGGTVRNVLTDTPLSRDQVGARQRFATVVAV